MQVIDVAQMVTKMAASLKSIVTRLWQSFAFGTFQLRQDCQPSPVVTGVWVVCNFTLQNIEVKLLY